MTLQPSSREPGVWVNPLWQPSTPATFGVVIGISRYAYLDGSARSLGLGQLEVSALTAFRVFEWLARDYYVEGCPLARCWLLLSPTPAEIEHEPAITTHYLEPTFENCESAIGWWAAHMQAQSPDAANDSRGVFFFSGHGLEEVRGQQVLAPSDYMRPPNRNWNRALSAKNLINGLASSRVPLHLFMLDACRESPALPNGGHLTGTPILPETSAPAGRNSYFTPILYATNSGQQAFQQPTPTKGLSLFGQALLDGLAGKPDLALKPTPSSLWVNLFPLQEFTMARVVEALENEQAVDPQPVILDGAYNALVTELTAQPDRIAGPPARTRDSEIDALSIDDPRRLAVIGTDAQRLESRALAGLEQTGELFGSASDWADDYSRTHAAFASENATYMWTEGMQLVAASTGVSIDAGALRIKRVRHDRAVAFWDLDLEIDYRDPIGYCLQLQDTSGRICSTLLPALGEPPADYRLQFALARTGGGARPLTRLHASAGEDSQPLLSELWRIYTFGGAGRTQLAIETMLATRASDMQAAPYVAVVAGLLALHLQDTELAVACSRFASAHATTTAGSYGDYVALSVGAGLRRYGRDPQESPMGEFAAYLSSVGMPATRLGTLVAADAARELMQASYALPRPIRFRLHEALDRFESARGKLTRGTLFATFVDTTAIEIARTAARGHGLAAVHASADGMTSLLNNTTQSAEAPSQGVSAARNDDEGEAMKAQV